MAVGAHLDDLRGVRGGLRHSAGISPARRWTCRCATRTMVAGSGSAWSRLWASRAAARPPVEAARRRPVVRRTAIFLAMAAALVLAFLWAGGFGRPRANTAAATGERVLLVAVGDHLERSQVILVELAHADRRASDVSSPRVRRTSWSPGRPALPADRGPRRRAGVASVLEELERVLVEVANAPGRRRPRRPRRAATTHRDAGLLFKVRVLGLAGPGAGASPRPVGRQDREMNSHSRSHVGPRVLAGMLAPRPPSPTPTPRCRARGPSRSGGSGSAAPERERRGTPTTSRYDKGTAALDAGLGPTPPDVRPSRESGRRADAALYWTAYAAEQAGPATPRSPRSRSSRRTTPRAAGSRTRRPSSSRCARATGQRRRPRSGRRGPEAHGAQLPHELGPGAGDAAAREVPLAAPVSASSRSARSSSCARAGRPRRGRSWCARRRASRSPSCSGRRSSASALFGGPESRQAPRGDLRVSSDATVKKPSSRPSWSRATRTASSRRPAREKDPELRARGDPAPRRDGRADRALGDVPAETRARGQEGHPPGALRRRRHRPHRRDGEHREGYRDAPRGHPDARAVRRAVEGRRDRRDLQDRERPPHHARRRSARSSCRATPQALIEIARAEKDPELKKKAVSQLANMHSKEATAFLLEILNK